jgi:lipoprotein-releasing system ATP-binding protein
MGQAILKLENVSKTYPWAAGELPILRDISFELGAGDTLAIIGPSGSGKSTLLNIIGTLDRPSAGRVWLDGQDVTTLDELALADVRNRQLGFVFQGHHLLPQCSVLENVLVPTLASKERGSRAAAPDRARKLLDRVGLGSRLDHRPGQLSGGERQRVAVVRALINQPKLLLADEPTGALDRTSALNLARLLIELNQEQNVTLILVTHALDLAGKMQRVLQLHDGQLGAEPGAEAGKNA